MCAAAPNRDRRDVGFIGLMKTPDQCPHDMTILRVVSVAGAVQVGRHYAAVVHTVANAELKVVGLTELDSSNLGNGVRLVGGLELPRQKCVSNIG